MKSVISPASIYVGLDLRCVGLVGSLRNVGLPRREQLLERITTADYPIMTDIHEQVLCPPTLTLFMSFLSSCLLPKSMTSDPAKATVGEEGDHDSEEDDIDDVESDGNEESDEVRLLLLACASASDGCRCRCVCCRPCLFRLQVGR